MARKPSSSGPIPVESITHSEKRKNIPTADAAGTFFDEDGASLPPLLYPRDTSLDPQLVWRGKDEQDKTDLVVDAPPIYIQEKIDPRVLIENLRKTAAKGESEPELTLFDDFDGLDELSQVEFYQHDANWANRMILGDSLQVMGSLAEREQLRGKVQMIYIDPPYGIKFGSNWQVSARKRDVKDGKLEDAVREAEQIKAFRDTWELGIHSYLSYLRDRLIVARDLLTESGSVFVQIGDENSHLVRSLLDEVLGSDNFISEVVFVKTSSATSDMLAPVADRVLWFAKSKDRAKYRQLYLEKNAGAAGGTGYTQVRLADGSKRPLTAGEKSDPSSLPKGASIFAVDNLTSQRPPGDFPVAFDGRTVRPRKGYWKTNPAGMERLIHAGRVHGSSTGGLGYIRMLNDFPVFPLSNVWTDTLGQNQLGGDKIYVVQTALRVVERCILMSSDPGDLVLDPTCGSGTTAVVAEQWGRRWITIDTSRVALALARQRLMAGKFPYYLLADSEAGRKSEQDVSGKPLPPANTANDIRRGFVHERVQHITLKSIANNPDIREGMSREEVDSAIQRHAEFEYLYDKPIEDKKSVRVSGPFTVESLSPHRALSFDDMAETRTRESIGERGNVTDSEQPSFEQSILTNLQRAGIQNGRRDERIEFAALDAYAGSYVQAVGEKKYADENDMDTASRVAVAIGPQYGTVSPGFIKNAAREAIADASVDLLCVLGFAFDPQATGVTEDDGVTIVAGDDGFANVEGERTLGRIKVLLVRMNADLLMGEDLKKTGAGNLFTVFGEPDIEIRDTADEKVEVELRGVDVYDPTTGEVRSRQTDRIAIWMIDTDYNEESFFVRHCYFTGGNDPYKKLKTALKADINPDAWATLNRTVSMPFDRPSTGKIAIKVINDYGDEVMKVFEVS